MKSSLKESTRQILNKVPEVTIFFWIIKIMATTVGESAADFLSVTLNLGLSDTSYIMGGLLLIALVVQVRSKKYVPWIYWLTVVLISIVGTLITDNLVDNIGITLEATSIAFSLALLATFVIWYSFEKTLSIHTIFTTRRELFYWAAILFTFALGTAAGDLVAEGFSLGYANSAMIFAALIGVVSVSYFIFEANAIAAFWFAYIMTRPLGASCGDLLAQPVSIGGLGLGTVATSGIFLSIIAGLVVYLSVSRNSECLPSENI